MGKIIAVISGKGGVGKTMVTANLGIALSKAGFRVCLIDADVAMANLSLMLGMQASPITLHDVLLGEASLHDALYDGPAGVSFIPSGLSLESYRRVDSEKLADVLEPLAGEFDFILLDAPPGIGKDVMAALSASHESILVTMPTSPAIADLLKVKIIAQRLGNKPIGIIMNCVRKERGEISDTEVMKMLELPVYGSIPFDDRVRKDFLQEKVMPILIRKPDAPASIAIKKIAEKISGAKIPAEKGKEKVVSFFKKTTAGKEIKQQIEKGAKPVKPGFFSRLFGFLKRK